MGTVLLELGENGSSIVTLTPHRAHDRMVALLAVAGRGKVRKAALAQIDAAVSDWRRGEIGLAAIRLTFAPLPRLRDHADAHRLTLADRALALGLPPHDLLAELGYIASVGPFLKYDPAQQRVPAGRGSASGQWTSGDAGGTANATPAPASVRPVADGAENLRPVPVFLRPRDGDEADEEIEDKWRRRGIGGTIEERIEEGRPLFQPAPAAPPGVEAPGAGDAAPGLPDTGAVPPRSQSRHPAAADRPRTPRRATFRGRHARRDKTTLRMDPVPAETSSSM